MLHIIPLGCNVAYGENCLLQIRNEKSASVRERTPLGPPGFLS